MTVPSALKYLLSKVIILATSPGGRVFHSSIVADFFYHPGNSTDAKLLGLTLQMKQVAFQASAQCQHQFLTVLQ